MTKTRRLERTSNTGWEITVQAGLRCRGDDNAACRRGLRGRRRGVHRRRKASVQPVGVHRLRSERIGSGAPKAAGADSSQRKSPHTWMSGRGGRLAPERILPICGSGGAAGACAPRAAPCADSGRPGRSLWRESGCVLWEDRCAIASTAHTVQENDPRLPRRLPATAGVVQARIRPVMGGDRPSSRRRSPHRKALVAARSAAQLSAFEGAS